MASWTNTTIATETQSTIAGATVEGLYEGRFFEQTYDFATDTRYLRVAWVNPRNNITTATTGDIFTDNRSATTTANTWSTIDCLEYDLDSNSSYIYYDGEMIRVVNNQITEKDINPEEIQKRKEQVKRDEWLRKLKEKRIQLRLGKAEDRGLELLERMVNKTQIKSYKKDGFIDLKDAKGNICRIFKSDSQFLEVYEKKKKIVIAKDMTTIEKLNKMDEFTLNGETFVLKKKVCTHHKNSDMPDVDGVISKIVHLRAGIDYGQFGNIYKHKRIA